MNLPVLEDREIKRDRLLRLRIKPKKRRDLLHRGTIMTGGRDSGNLWRRRASRNDLRRHESPR